MIVMMIWNDNNNDVVRFFICLFYFLNSECFVTGGKPSTFIPTFAAFEDMLRLINKKLNHSKS